jgi:hypothetical protein
MQLKLDLNRLKKLIIENHHRATRMRAIILLLFVSIINACAASSEVDTGNAEVESGHRIYCSGSAYSWETCYDRASEICGGKEYDILQKYEDDGAFVAYESARELPDRRLIIQCKE